MPDFSLPEGVRMETLRRGVQQAGCPSCTPYAVECSQPLISAKNQKKVTPQSVLFFVEEGQYN
jgi:hypothetical protein